MPTIWDAIPSAGFFPQYLDYALSVTDAPEIYHVAAGLAGLSTAVSGKAQLQFTTPTGAQSTFPLHLWIMLLGKSGGRKSAASDRALAILAPFVGEHGPTGGSPEGFYTWLAEHPVCIFYFTEMAALFGLQQASYWQQGQTFFTAVYDGNDFKKTLMSSEKGKKGTVLEIEIPNPRVSLLGCATPSLLDTSTRDVDWTGGMIGRMMPFLAERKGLTVWPNQRKVDSELAIQNEVAAIIEAVGDSAVVGLTRSAMGVYAEWATALDEQVNEYPERLQALIVRLPQHILRVSALYAISTGDADVTIDNMTRAINLADYAKETIVKLGEILTPDKIARMVKVLRTKLLQCPSYTISVRDILKIMNVSWKVLEPAVKSLAEGGELRLVQEGARKWMKLVDVPIQRNIAPQPVVEEEEYAAPEGFYPTEEP